MFCLCICIAWHCALSWRLAVRVQLRLQLQLRLRWLRFSCLLQLLCFSLSRAVPLVTKSRSLCPLSSSLFTPLHPLPLFLLPLLFTTFCTFCASTQNYILLHDNLLSSFSAVSPAPPCPSSCHTAHLPLRVVCGFGFTRPLHRPPSAAVAFVCHSFAS